MRGLFPRARYFHYMITFQKKALCLLWRSTCPVAAAAVANKVVATFLVSALCLPAEKRRNNVSVPAFLHMYDSQDNILVPWFRCAFLFLKENGEYVYT